MPLSLQRLEEELRLHKCSTRECIEQFYLDKLKQVGLSVSALRPALGASFIHWLSPLASPTEVSGAEPVWAPDRPVSL